MMITLVLEANQTKISPNKGYLSFIPKYLKNIDQRGYGVSAKKNFCTTHSLTSEF